ncbi:hypothetical protein ACHWQZ_G005143 [Mnemiopsis leidyi]
MCTIITGVQLRHVHISTSNRDKINSELWLSSDSSVSTLLWQDPDQISWVPGTAYRWFISHRASTGSIEIQIYTAKKGYWYLVAMRLNLQENRLSVFRDGVDETVELDKTKIVVNTSAILYLGSDTNQNFSGVVTDVRILSRLLSSDILTVLTLPSLSRQRKMGIVTLHLTFTNKSLQDSQSSVQRDRKQWNLNTRMAL